MAEQKTYRHRDTGLVGVYPESLARAHADVLTEVAPGTKRRAYTSIPQATVEAVISKRVAEPSGDTTIGTAPDSTQPAPSSADAEAPQSPAPKKRFSRG